MNSTVALTPQERQDFARMVKEAEKLPRNYLLCRTVGHAWEPIAPDREPLFGRLLVWQCMRCTTKRDDIFDVRWGQLIQRSYRYAEGYIIPRGKRGASNMLARTALRVVFDRQYNG